MQNIIKQDINVRWSVVSDIITNPMHFVDQNKAMDCFLLLTQRGDHAELLRTTYIKSTEIIASSSEFDFAEDKR